MSARPDCDMPLQLADIRPAGRSDLQAVFQLNQASFTEAWSLTSLTEALDAGNDIYVWDAIAGRIAAYMLCQTIADELHILQLVVAAPFQHRGYGQKLCRHVMRLKHQQGINRVLLEVRASNTAAIHLYQRLAFDIIGKRHGYYVADHNATGREDAIVMSLTL